MEFSSLSKVYVKTLVRATLAGLPVDPHAYPVAFAFTASRHDHPADADIIDGDWEQDPGRGWLARCLVGPGGTAQLMPGRYAGWCRVSGSPEVPFEVFDTGIVVY